MKRNTKILLANPPSSCVDDDRLEPHLGLLYIAANLRENGYRDVSIYDMTGCKGDKEISDKIDNIPEAEVYGITSFCTNYPYAKRVIVRIKSANPDAYLVIGGPNPSGIPEFTLENSGADAVIVGEGEDPFLHCIEAYNSNSPQRGIIKGKARDNIDTYPFPARDLVDIKTYSRRLMGEPVVSILSSRGCKHHCIHCNSIVMGGGSAARYRTAQNITEEIEGLRGEFRYFRFNDDHFTGNPDLEELSKRMADLGAIFRAFARIEDLNDRTSGLLAGAGCVHTATGMESLNPDNLRILGKAPQIGHEGNVRIAKSHGLTVRSSFMVGLPYDTDETIKRYFQEAAKLGLDEFSVYPLIPYPGTKIWEHPERFGYTITNRDFTDYVQMGSGGRVCYAMRHENFGPEDVARWKLMVEEMLEAVGARHMRESKVAK